MKSCNYLNEKERIYKEIVTTGEVDRKGRLVYDLIPTNYGNLHPLVKINILDTIINEASAVFGPYGGIYGELKGADMMGGQEITEGGYEKSKDGHSFFNSLELGSKYAQTIMKSIQQMTKYVAGYSGDTSRDGTTSVAIVGCNAAKFLLAERMNKREIPSMIQNAIFDIVTSAGLELINKYKVPVYDSETCKYLDHGYERAYNAIKTTVDGNSLFTVPFGDLMKRSVEEGYDLLNCYLSTPNNIDGIANLELKTNAGIRFRAANLDTKQGGGFYNHNSFTFMLDGYISSEHRDCYVYYLQEWLKQLCSARDKEGLLFAPGRFDAPLLIVTRTPEYLENVYKRIGVEGVKVQDGRGAVVTIKPKFMLGNNTDSFKTYYDDMLTVFSECKVDLNLMNRYIRDNKVTSDEIDPSIGQAKHVGQKEVDLSKLFPTIQPGNQFGIAIPTTDESWDPDMPGEQEAKFKTCNWVTFPSRAVQIVSNYDGQSLSLVPPTPEHVARANAKREELLELKKSLSDLSLEEHMIPERLAFFSSMTIKPFITARSKDEYTQMFSIYEDALGVFQSVHKHGVMPGGNIFLLKFEEEFRAICDEMLEPVYKATNVEEKKELYKEFAQDVFSSVMNAYASSYELLTRDEFKSVYNTIREHKEDILETYNLISGEWDTEIVEAARTTADVFASAITMMKDMYQLKRIKLYVQSGEHTQVHLANNELRLAPIYENTELALEYEE